jgi:NAD-dependent deacetylase
MESNIYENLNQILKKANHICFFGGAGVSTNSGLLDFRSKEGLYNLESKYGRSYEEMLSIDYFYEDTSTFYKFYKEFMIKPNVRANKAHIALKKFNDEYNNVSIVTQNIDGLHQDAGSTNVIEIHGSIFRNYCPRCFKHYDIDKITHSIGVPLCSCGGIIRPDVVLYGEPLESDVWYDAANAFARADVLIIGGTSLNVYPAVDLIRYYRGKCLIIINKEKTPYDHLAQFVFHEDIGEVLEKIMKI